MELKKSMSQKLRMDGRDYKRPGWYFVTLGADYHKHLFGTVDQGAMLPNDLGRLVEQCWREIPRHYDHIALGAWQFMPTIAGANSENTQRQPTLEPPPC